MIVDFVAAAVRRRVAHGQPLLSDAFQASYLRCKESFESLDPITQVACMDATKAAIEYLAGRPDKNAILFIAPKSNGHVEGTVDLFNPIRIDANSTAPPCVQQGVLHLPVQHWHYLIGKVLSSTGDSSLAWMQFLLKEVTRFLQATRPKLILFSTDVQYFERVVALVAKTLNIPTAGIQHGIFSSKFDPSIFEGDASDYFIVWGEFTKRFIQKSGYLSPNCIFVSGYPYPVRPLTPIKSGDRGARSLVFLGQPFENFRTEHSKAKNEIAKLVMEACEKLGLDFHYRPHPVESVESLAGYIPTGRLLPVTIPLQQLFQEHAAFVSLTSSAVIEAGIYGRVAIQVYDELFDFENLEEVGACYACDRSAQSIEEILSRFKSGALLPKPVDPDFLPVHADVASVFREIYLQIIEDHRRKRPGPGSKPPVKLVCQIGGVPETGDGPLPHRLIDCLVALRPGEVPAGLDVEELARQFESWQDPATCDTIDSPYIPFVFDYLSETRTTKGLTFEISRPDPGRSLPWLTAISRALEVASLEPSVFRFPERQPESRSDDVTGELIYRVLATTLNDDGPAPATRVQKLKLLIENLLEETRARKMLAPLDAHRAQALALSQASVGYLQPYRERLEQIRATKLWKFAESARKLIRRGP